MTDSGQRSEKDDSGLLEQFYRLCEVSISMGAAERDLNLLLHEVVGGVREVIDARYAALGLLNESGDELAEFVVSGMTPEEIEKVGSLPIGRGILGTLIRDPRPLRLGDLSQHPDSYGFPPDHPRMKSFLGVPIVGRAGPIGNLYLTEKISAPEFSEEDQRVATMFAQHVAVAVENARLYSETLDLLKEIKTLQQSRDRFFATINHELRNSLTAVHGWADLLVRKLEPDPPRSAVEVLESSEHTLILIEDLLLLSRIDAGRFVPNVRRVSPAEFVDQAVRSVSPQARRQKIEIRVTGPDEAPWAETDPQRARQILVNLLSNAVSHGPPGRPVTLDWKNTGESLRFDVHNHGPALPQELAAGLFEEFVVGDETRSRGAGLGLALSRRLARLLGGDLTLDPGREEGVVFTLEIARELADPEEK